MAGKRTVDKKTEEKKPEKDNQQDGRENWPDRRKKNHYLAARGTRPLRPISGVRWNSTTSVLGDLRGFCPPDYEESEEREDNTAVEDCEETEGVEKSKDLPEVD